MAIPAELSQVAKTLTYTSLGGAKVGIGTTVEIAGGLKINGALRDQYGNVGVAGSVLTSTGIGISWSSSVGSGAQGTSGSQGLQGLQGTEGIQGTQGIQGTAGAQGSQGAQGTQGLQGIQGLQGTQGLQGLQGVQGSGAQGSTGTGSQGAQGTQGLGTQGTQGVAGSAGSGLTITDDTTTNSVRYPTFVDVTTGTATATYVSSSKLNFNPSTGTFSATVFTSLSDRSQKTDITTITDAIETVKKLRGVRYKWVDDHNQPSMGVIAQEIEEVLPEVVTENPGGLKSVSYGNIIGLLIEAIKEQQLRIEELERRNG